MASGIPAVLAPERLARMWPGTRRSIDLTKLDGDGGINPKYLTRDPNNGCKTIQPWQYLRVNTIFEVVKSHGGLTAWTDKPSLFLRMRHAS
jgi:hypothetical protein